MQMFAFKHTEASIRELRARKMRQAREEARLNEIDQLQAKIDSLKAEIETGQTYPVYRSMFHRLEVVTCRLFGVKRSELHSTRREKKLAFARHFLMYWACRRTSLSTPQIGRLMGGRDHTTILHGRDVYPKKRAKMGRFLREVR